jgi:hypothetical protein
MCNSTCTAMDISFCVVVGYCVTVFNVHTVPSVPSYSVLTFSSYAGKYLYNNRGHVIVGSRKQAEILFRSNSNVFGC